MLTLSKQPAVKTATNPPITNAIIDLVTPLTSCATNSCFTAHIIAKYYQACVKSKSIFLQILSSYCSWSATSGRQATWLYSEFRYIIIDFM